MRLKAERGAHMYAQHLFGHFGERDAVLARRAATTSKPSRTSVLLTIHIISYATSHSESVFNRYSHAVCCSRNVPVWEGLTCIHKLTTSKKCDPSVHHTTTGSPEQFLADITQFQLVHGSSITARFFQTNIQYVAEEQLNV